MDVPKMNEAERKAAEQATLDIAAGKNHLDITPSIKSEAEHKSDDISKLYLGDEGGYTRKRDLKSKAGIAADASWTDHVNNGGYIPEGYEIESKLLVADEKRQSLHKQYLDGAMSQSDFLFEAYGRDYLKSQGHDMSSPSYWMQQFKKGEYGSPLDNPVLLGETLEKSEALYRTDEAIHGLYEKSFSFNNGEEMTEKSFAEAFGQQFTDEYVQALGGYGAMMSKYQAGMLPINPFIDANGDGKIGDGDYFYHDDGRVYQIGVGCQIKQTDKNGMPTEVHVGKVDAGDHAKTFFVGLANGILGIGESICQLGALIADAFVPGELTVTKKFTETTEKWKNSLRIGDTAVFNDDIWTADGVHSAASNVNQVMNAVGNISGMILTAVLTMGASTAIDTAKAGVTGTTKAAMATLRNGMKDTSKVAIKEAAKKLVKETGSKLSMEEAIAIATKNAINTGQRVTYRSALKAVKQTALEAGKNAGLQSAKYTALELASTMVNGLGATTQFSQGVFKTSAKHAADAVRTGFLANFRQAMSGTFRSATSAAILTSRDFVDNVARAATLNDIFVNEDGTFAEGHRTTAEIFGDAAGIAALNFGISTVLRATWDDVGLTGRVGEIAQGVNKASGYTHKGLGELVRLCNSTSRFRTVIDTLSDSTEMIFTTINNQFAQNGGFSKANGEDWARNAKGFLTSPAGITSLLFSTVSTYRGGLGRTSYGAEHQAYDYTANTSNKLSDGVMAAMNEAVNKITAKPITDPTRAKEVDAALSFIETSGRGFMDSKEVVNGFGFKFTADGKSVQVTGGKDSTAIEGKVIFEKGSCPEARDGDIVFALKPVEGELSITQLPSSFMTTLNVIKIKKQLGDKSSDIIDQAVNDYLKTVDLDIIAQREYQVAATIAMEKEYKSKVDRIALDSKEKKNFFQRLSSPETKQKMQDLFHRFHGSKWASVMDANEMSAQKSRWNEFLENPKALFDVGEYSNSDTYPAFCEIQDMKNANFFAYKSTETIVENMIVNKDTEAKLKSSDAVEAQKLLAVLDKAKTQHGLEGEELSGLSVLHFEPKAKDWHTAEGEAQIKRIQAESEFLYRVGQDPNYNKEALGDKKFFVVKIEKPTSDGKGTTTDYYYCLRPGSDEMDALQNRDHVYDIMLNTTMLSTGDIQQKTDALDNIIRLMTVDAGDTDSDLRNKRVYKIIEMAMEEGMISRKEAVSLLDHAFESVRAYEKETGKLKDAYEFVQRKKAVARSFADWQNAVTKKQLRPGDSEYNEKQQAYTTAVNEMLDLIPKADGDKPNPEYEAIVSDKGGLITPYELKTIEHKIPENFRVGRLYAYESAASGESKQIKALTLDEAKKILNDARKISGAKDYSKEIKDDFSETFIKKAINDQVTYIRENTTEKDSSGNEVDFFENLPAIVDQVNDMSMAAIGSPNEEIVLKLQQLILDAVKLTSNIKDVYKKRKSIDIESFEKINDLIHSSIKTIKDNGLNITVLQDLEKIDKVNNINLVDYLVEFLSTDPTVQKYNSEIDSRINNNNSIQNQITKNETTLNKNKTKVSSDKEQRRSNNSIISKNNSKLKANKKELSYIDNTLNRSSEYDTKDEVYQNEETKLNMFRAKQEQVLSKIKEYNSAIEELDSKYSELNKEYQDRLEKTKLHQDNLSNEEKSSYRSKLAQYQKDIAPLKKAREKLISGTRNSSEEYHTFFVTYLKYLGVDDIQNYAGFDTVDQIIKNYSGKNLDVYLETRDKLDTVLLDPNCDNDLRNDFYKTILEESIKPFMHETEDSQKLKARKEELLKENLSLSKQNETCSEENTKLVSEIEDLIAKDTDLIEENKKLATGLVDQKEIDTLINERKAFVDKANKNTNILFKQYKDEVNKGIEINKGFLIDLMKYTNKIISSFDKDTVLKDAFLKHVKEKYPTLMDSINLNSEGKLESMAQDKSISADTFVKAIADYASAKDVNERLAENLVEFSKIMSRTSQIKTNNKLVLDITKIETAAEAKMRRARENDLQGIIASDKSAEEEIQGIEGGALGIAMSSKALSTLLLAHQGQEYITFNLDNDYDARVLKDIFEDLGYNNPTIDMIANLPCAKYHPNSDRGFIVKTSYDPASKRNSVPLARLTGNDGKITLNAKQHVFDLAMNEVRISDDAPIGFDNIAFVLADITDKSYAREVIGTSRKAFKEGVKMGKAAGKIADMITKVIKGIKALGGNEDTSYYTSLQTTLAVMQALDVTNQFFSTSFDQAKEPIYLKRTKANDARILDLINLGFSFKNKTTLEEIKTKADLENSKDSVMLSGFNYNDTTISKAMEILSRTGDISHILPLDPSVMKEIKQTKVYPTGVDIFAFGTKLAVDQKTFAAQYDNFLSVALRKSQGDGFDTLARLCAFNGVDPTNIKAELIPKELSFTEIETDIEKCKTIGELKDKINSILEIEPNNIYALQVKTQLNGLEILSDQESEYKFLADANIRKAIIDNIDKSPEEITKIIKDLPYYAPKEKDNTSELKDTIGVNNKSLGAGSETQDVTADLVENFGIKSTKETFEELKGYVTEEAISKLVNDTIQLTSIFEDVYAVKDLDDPRMAENNIDAMLTRSKMGKDDDGNFEYHISMDDIAELDDLDIQILRETFPNDPTVKQIINAWQDLNDNIIMKGLDAYNGADPTLTQLKKEITNLSKISIENKGFSMEDADIDEYKKISKNREYAIALRNAKKLGMQKMASLNASYKDELSLQYNLNKFMTDNALITNDGNRMMYNMQNTYQSSKFLFAYANMQDEIKTRLNLDDEVSSKLALDMLAKTTGVDRSDGYEGAFLLNEDGTYTSAIRTNTFRSDDSNDLLLEYFNADSSGKRPKNIVLMDKNSGVDSANLHIIPVTDEVHNKLKKAFVDKTVYERRAGQTVEEFWASQIPRVKINEMLVNNLMDELGIDKEFQNQYRGVFKQTAFALAKTYEDNYASLTTEGLLQYMFENYEDELHGLDRNQFSKLKNKYITNVMDVVKYGVTEDFLPVGVKNKLRELGHNLTTDEAVRHYHQVQDKASVNVNDSMEDYALAYIFNSHTGVNDSFILKAFSNKTMDTNRQELSEPYKRWKSLQSKTGYGKPFVTFDCEWLFDKNGNRYLQEIGLKKYHMIYDSKSNQYIPEQIDDGITISLNIKDVIKKNFGEDTPKIREEFFKLYEERMTKKLQETDDYKGLEGKKKIEEYFNKKYNSSYGINGEDSDLDSIEQTLRDYLQGDYTFLSYNGKNKNSDIDTIKGSDLDFLISDNIIRDDNHIDGYNEMVLVLNPDYRFEKRERTNPNTGEITLYTPQLDFRDLTNTGLYKQIFGEYAKDAHNALADIDMTTKTIAALFSAEPHQVKSQMEDFKENLSLELQKAEYPQEDIDKNIDTIISNIKDKIYKNRNLAHFNNDEKHFAGRLSEYKTISNTQLRKAMNTLNSLRTAQDLKLRNYAVRDAIDSVVKGEFKEVFEGLKANYDKITQILSYVTTAGNNPEDIKARYDRVSKVLAKMYGKYDSVSKFGIFDALNKLVDNDEVDRFFDLLNQEKVYHMSKTTYTFSKKDMESAEYNVSNMNSFLDKIKDNNPKIDAVDNELLKDTLRLLQSDGTEIDRNSFNAKLNNMKDFVNFGNERFKALPDIDGESFMDRVSDYIMESFASPVDGSENPLLYNDIYGDNAQIRSDKVSELYKDFNDPEYLKDLEEIMADGENFTRAYGKATAMNAGDIVQDIHGNDVVVTSQDVVVSKQVFEETFGATYDEVLESFRSKTGDKNLNEINVAILRQPSDKPATLNPFRVIVVPNGNISDKSIRITTTAMFSRCAGDFDGDNLMMYRSTPEESKYYGRIREYQYKTFGLLDQVYENAIRYAAEQGEDNQTYSDDFMKVVYDFQTKPKYKSAYNSIFNEVDRLLTLLVDGKQTSFENEYQISLNKINDELDNTDLSPEHKKLVVDMYFLNQKDIEGESKAYQLRRGEIYSKLNNKQKAVLSQMNAKYMHASGVHKQSQSKVPYETGSTEEKILFEQLSKSNFEPIKDLRYRPITLDTKQELLLRQYFNDPSNMTEIMKIVDQELKDLKIDNKSLSISFEDFMHVLALSEKKNFTNTKQSLRKNEDNIYKMHEAMNKKIKARLIASSIHEEILENKKLGLKYTGSNIVDQNIALSVIRNISDRFGTKVKKTGPKGTMKWVIHPLQNDAAITGPFDERIVLFNQDQNEFTSYDNIKLKGEGNTLYQQGDTIKAGSHIGDTLIQNDSVIEEIDLQNRTMKIISKQKNIPFAAKVIDISGMVDKSIVSRSSANVSRSDKQKTSTQHEQADKYYRWIQQQKQNGLTMGDFFGYSNAAAALEKRMDIPSPDKIMPVFDPDDNTKLIGVAILEPLSVIENQDAFKAEVKKRPIDLYSYMNNALTATGQVMLGSHIFSKDNDGNIIVDTDAENRLANVSRTVESNLLGKKDGRGTYQIMVLSSLLDMCDKSKMDDETFRNYAMFMTTPEAQTEAAKPIILKLLYDNFYDEETKSVNVLKALDKEKKEIENRIAKDKDISDSEKESLLRMNKIKRVLLSSELFEHVMGTSFTGIKANGTYDDLFSKNKAGNIATQQSGEKSFGKDETTNSDLLINSGIYRDNSFISRLDLMNLISRELGFGITTDAQAIQHNVAEGRIDVEKKDSPTVYAYSSKDGVPGTASTTTYDMAGGRLPEFSLGNGLESKNTLWKNYKKRNFFLPKEAPLRDKNQALRLYSTSANKTYNAIMALSDGKENILNNIEKISTGAARRSVLADPHTEFRIDNEGQTINPYVDPEQYIKTYSIQELMEEQSDRSSYKNAEIARLHAENELSEDLSTRLTESKSKDKELWKEINDEELNKSALLENKIEDYNEAKKFQEEQEESELISSNEEQRRTSYLLNKMTNTTEYEDVDDAASKTVLRQFGFEENDNESGVALANAMPELRNIDSSKLSTPGVINDMMEMTQETLYDINAKLDSLERIASMSNDGTTGLNRYMSLRGVSEAMDYVSKMETAGRSSEITLTKADLMETLKELGFNSIESAKQYMQIYEQRNPRVVVKAMNLAMNAYQMVNGVRKASGGELQFFSLLLTQRAKANATGAKESNKKRLKSSVESLWNTLVHGHKASGVNTFKGNNIQELIGSNCYIDFISNMRTLGTQLAKTQAIMRCASKLPKNNAVVKNLLREIIKEDLTFTSEDKPSDTDLAKYSKIEKRSTMFSIIGNRLGIYIHTTKEPWTDYINALRQVEESKISSLKAAGVSEDISLDELKMIEQDGSGGEFVSKAIDAFESEYELYCSLISTSPSLKNKIISSLKECSVEGSKTMLVDHLGRIIHAGYKDGDYLIRKPITDMDLSYIRDAICDCPDNKEDYETALAVRALMGEVYVMDSLVAKKLDQHVFTTKVPSMVMSAIQKSSRICSKLLMSQPLKIIRRLMQFSLYDFNMAMTANPKTAYYMSKSKKELSAFFQSKGAACSEDLKDYLEHQGFKYSDIKGYDPVQMEATGDKSILDRAYFDKVNNLFSMQNLLVRYALYAAEKADFDSDGPKHYGVMYHKKGLIDKMSDNGAKAMQVVDATIGGQGGFSEASKVLGQYGMVFTTFPLAVARWGKEGVSTARALLTGAGEADYGDMWRHLGSPIVTMGATYGVIYGIIMALCNLFGVDKEDAEEMAKNQEFIDPISTILNDGVVQVEDNSIFQLQAIVDAFDSFREEESFGGKVLGFVNDNFLSHFNPILKAATETVAGVDAYGGSIKKNDYSIKENAERKLLGFLIGSAGSNALIKEQRYQNITGNESLEQKIGAVLGAEIGNTKAYKSEKKSYYKTLSNISNFFKSNLRDNKDQYEIAEEGFNTNKVYKLSRELKQAVTNHEDISRITALVNNAIKDGFTADEIRSSIKSVSVIGKLETIESMGLTDLFYKNMSDKDYTQLKKAILFEQKYFPYMDDLLDRYHSDEERRYSSLGYFPRNYRSNTYYQQPRPLYKKRNNYNNYSRPSYYNKSKSRYGNEIPSIKDLFVRKMTNTTGKNAITISDLIGEYYDNYYNDYQGQLSGERYKDRKNKKQSQTDWRN